MPTLQKVATQEPTLRDKGKGKEIDVTNIPSSSTSISLLLVTHTTTRVIGPKVVTQEPTMGKTSLPRDNTKHMGKGADTQEPTSTIEVEPQEPILHPNDTRIEEHSEGDIITETTTMLKNLANLFTTTTTSQVKILPALGVSTTRYATWLFNALP